MVEIILRASDIKIEEIIKRDPKSGFPLFGSHRLMLSGIASLKRFGDDLNLALGHDKMRAILTRLGYENGLTAAMAIGEMYEFDSPLEWLKSARSLLIMAGIVNLEFTTLNLDYDSKRLEFSVLGHESFEAANYSANNPDKNPNTICNLLVGLLSGFASAVLGQEVLVRETQCMVQGNDICVFEGKSVSFDEADLKAWQKQLTLEPLDEEITRLKAELERSREDLIRRDTEIKRLRKKVLSPEITHGLIYRSKSMSNILNLASKVAATDVSVLIQGESGTGKELIARFIHKHSSRKKDPFLAVNCAAMPETLLESELFGHVRGAFTGAANDKKGLLIAAGRGTFFLDEVGEMPMDIQAKLLRVLQEKEVRPLGGTAMEPVHARIIAATNRDLKTLIKSGRFREDLYYRLSVFPLTIEPLRRRREDILILARHFLSSIRPDHHGFDPRTVRYLEKYSWPGNVRELQNCIEYSSVMAGNNSILSDHLPPAVISEGPSLFSSLTGDVPSLAEIEAHYIQWVLNQVQGNKKEAARILNIGSATLWRHLKKHPD
ncbi:MAG: AAA family ATPase [Desulfobacteraceae bacterium]|jgi:DNA-binding NtrC family response regulator/predicted hydrocarbon binding protein|nr:MAG: AAA family ATPase [Desulfobacteraceae bacterium]